MKIILGSAGAVVAGLLLMANVASAQQGPPSGRPGNNVRPPVSAPPHASVPEIDVMSGLAAFAAICGVLALAWERRQKV